MATTILGLARFYQRLARIPIAARREIKKAIKISADDLAEQIRNAVPVDDGDLRASVKVDELSERQGRFGYAVKAGSNRAFYAAMQEFGTVKMRANPFFFPTYRANKKRIRSRIRRAVRKAARS